MDIQMKKGLLEVCVLSVLQRGDSYGYQIVKDISTHIEIAESTLYPILKRLEIAHCLRIYSVEHNGRLRKYYSVTPLGITRIRDFLDGWETVNNLYQYIKEGAEK